MGSEEQEQPTPVKQSRVATESARTPASVDDPMASIRPELPASMPVIAPTVELSNYAQQSAPTEGASGVEHSQVAGDSSQTQDSGLFVLHVLAPPPTLDMGSDPTVHEEADAPEARVHAPYELIDRIGAGGMGEVWEAKQRSLERPVALKRLREGKKMPRSVQLQFESEARLAAILDHPNIVTIYELGLDQGGRVFYTMKRIEGTPWYEVIQTGQRKTGDGVVVDVDLRDHLEILIEVSQAVAFAHSRGVIHRDIKPGNVMIGDYGEVLLVDWGLAVAMQPVAGLGKDKIWILEDLPRSTLTCGTPAYMSPETAMALRQRIGPATDVYLLGAVLFHLLYRRPPHRGKTVKQVIAKAKVNGWTYPSEIPGKVKPWDALLRPVINRALATDPEARYADAGEFGDALRQAMRNYDSAKVATKAQEELAKLEQRENTDAGDYPSVTALIARLETALESWPRNLAARRALAQAHLEMATLALANDDLSLARLSLESFANLPPIPEPEVPSRRLTLHPVDGTLISAPKPTDSLINAGTSNEWVSSADSPIGRSPAALAKTIGAAEMARARSRRADGTQAKVGRGPQVSSMASVQVQDKVSESMLDEEHLLAVKATRLRHKIRERERGVQQRRRGLWLAAGLAGVLATAVVVVSVLSRVRLQAERDDFQAQRDALTRVLLDETADTVSAELEVQLDAVHGALTTALRWADQGYLDSEDPEELNRYFMPLLEGVHAATSALRADSVGNEYMLLRHPDGWHTRSTSTQSAPPTLRSWTLEGELRETRPDEPGYDPHARPWYQGGEALREAARSARLSGGPTPVFWTEPYRFFTTQDLGISVSAPVTSRSGREFVIAFDVKLDDVTRVTAVLPKGSTRGQTFILDRQLRLLGLPRETTELSAEARKALLLARLDETEAAPISRAALDRWIVAGEHTEPFLFMHGGERFWARFRLADAADRPKVWIGVVVPESEILEDPE